MHRLHNLETRRKLQALQAKKQAYKIEREALARQLVVLDNKIIETQAEYGAIYNHDAPLLSLPNEIVAQIFWFGVAIQGTNDVRDQYPLIEIVVSHVCKRWREIALSLPVIWSTFSCIASEDPNPERSLARLSAYLSRSKHHLLELWLDLDPGTSGWNKSDDDGYIQLVKAILPHAERWHRVTIWVDSKTDIGHEPFQHINAPHLIHFSLLLNTQDDYPFGDSLYGLRPMILCGGAPNLTSVFLDGRGFSTFLPPLDNVTTLRIEENMIPFEAPTSEIAFFEMWALPALANLSIIGNVFALDADDVSWPPTILMANLKHLRFSGSVILFYALTILKAPLLETLQLKDIDGTGGYLPGIATATTFPSLRSLATQECILPDSLATFICKITAGITTLLVSQELFDDSVLIPAIFLPEFPWPNLKIASLDLGLGMLDISLFVDRYPGKQPLTIRVPEARVDNWEIRGPDSHSTLTQKCNVERLNDDNPIQLEPSWPPGYDTVGIRADDDNHFDIEEYYL